MKIVNRLSLTFMAAVIISGTALTVPVAARDGSDDSSSTNSQDRSGNSKPPRAETENNTETENENHAKDLKEQFHELSQEKLNALRQEKKEQTQLQRQKACEKRKAGLTKRMQDAVRYAQKHEAVFDKLYTRVKNFYETKQLTVTDYDSLVAAVDEAQANSAASIAALRSLEVNVDCTSETVADDVAAFQQAVKSTRDNLQTYKSALVNLIMAVKSAAEASEDNG